MSNERMLNMSNNTADLVGKMAQSNWGYKEDVHRWWASALSHRINIDIDIDTHYDDVLVAAQEVLNE